MDWHEFTAESDVDWTADFRADAVEICLNLAGRGEVEAGGRRAEFAPQMAGFYWRGDAQIVGRRAGGERHRFVTIELSREFLARHVVPRENTHGNGLHTSLASLMGGKRAADVSEPTRLTSDQRQLALSLRRPPVAGSALRLWYQAKALEAASALFFQPAADGELFCRRCQRQAHERVQRVVALLKENLASPPGLEEIGRRVGCSHFYLSRIFSREMGQGIFQHLRALRLERAAELLREGRLNVTEVALEVGYSSPSHFSTAFHETFGCCPGLYPLKTATQRALGR